MPIPFVRPLVAGAVAALCLAATARDARADPTSTSPAYVTFDTGDAKLEVFDRTNDVVMAPRRARYGSYFVRENVYASVCTSTPCDAALAPGDHELALSAPGGSLVHAGTVRLGEGPVRLKGTLNDRSLVRGIGVVTFIGGAVTGAALIAAGYDKYPVTNCYGDLGACSHGYESDKPLTYTGIGVAAVGAAVGLFMMLLPDTASFEVLPFTVGAAPGRREAGAGAVLPSGLAVSMRF